MTPLETALVILVSIWTLIFIIIAIAMIVLLIGIKKAMDKINGILDEGQDFARGFGTMGRAAGRAAAGGLGGLLARTVGEYFNRPAIKKPSKRK